MPACWSDTASSIPIGPAPTSSVSHSIMPQL